MSRGKRRRKRKQAGDSPAPQPPAPNTAPAKSSKPPTAPRKRSSATGLLARYEGVWFGLPVPAAKLALFRFLFFGVLALDAWQEIEHAPRYGAGDFNVGHFPGLEFLFGTPSRSVMLTVFVAQAYLATRVALGAAGRGTIIALTCLFGYGYFVSQLDSYQHHYLVFLLLACTCFLPARGSADEPRDNARWPIRLILVQVSILYLWASVAKLEPLWLDGTTLSTQLTSPGMRSFVENNLGWPLAAKLTIALEVFLAIAIHIPFARVVALAVGAVFHITIQAVGFKIGLFSYFMLAIYALLIPNVIIDAIAGAVRWVRRSIPFSTEPLDRNAIASTGAVVAAVVVGVVAMMTLPFEGLTYAIVFAALAAGLSYGLMMKRRGEQHVGPTRLAITHAAACGLLVILAATTDTARDYHRFWGGSLRRLGNLEQATTVYERAVAVAPDYAPGHTSLGNLYRRTGRQDEALSQYKHALRLAPTDWRPNLGAAIVYDAQGNGDAALAAANNVLRDRPGNREASAIVSRWQRSDP